MRVSNAASKKIKRRKNNTYLATFLPSIASASSNLEVREKSRRKAEVGFVMDLRACLNTGLAFEVYLSIFMFVASKAGSEVIYNRQ